MTTAIEVGFYLIRHLEGCRLTPYRDVKGVWTIGIGSLYTSLGRVSVRTPKITMAEAEALFDRELKSHVQIEVDKLLKGVALNALQGGAVLSFTYNVGVYAFETSTMLKMLRDGNIEGAADQFHRWVFDDGTKIMGLVNRRLVEEAVFRGKVDPTLYMTETPDQPAKIYTDTSTQSTASLNNAELARVRS